MAGPGDIVATLTARVDGFISSLTTAVNQSNVSTKRISDGFDSIQKQIDGVKRVLETLGVAFTIHEAIDFVKNIIDAEEHLGNLAQKAGVSVEALGGLAFASKNTGLDIDSLAQGLAKLDRTIAEAATGNAKASDPFNALGISVKNASGQIKSADVIFAEVADKFATYADGPNKTALAIALFGRAGADLIATLNKGGDALRQQQAYFKQYSGVTAETVEQSKEFNETLNKIDLLAGAFGKTLASELLPPLQNVADAFLHAKEEGDGFKGLAQDIAEVMRGAASIAIELGTEVVAVGKAIGFLAAEASNAKDFVRFDAKAAGSDVPVAPTDEELKISGEELKNAQDAHKQAKLIFDAYKSDLDDLKKHAQQAQDALNGAGRAAAIQIGGDNFSHEGRAGTGVVQPKRQAPGLTNRDGSKDVDNDKKLLDQRLKDLDTYIAAERQQLTDREAFLQIYYQRGFLSLDDYYGGLAAARTADLNDAKKAYQQEIADLQAFIDKKTAAGTDKDDGKAIEAGTKLIEVRAKLAKLEGDAATQSQKDFLAQQAAAEKFMDTLNALAARVKSISGDTAGAFAISFDAQNRELTRSLNATTTSDRSSDADKAAAQGALNNLAALRAQGVAEAQLNDLTKDRSIILGDLANEQSRIDLAVSQGNKSELQGLADSSAANKARIAYLEQIAAAYDAIAAKSLNPQDQFNAETLHTELDKLKSQTDLVADAFDKAGKDVTANFFDVLVDRTKTTKEKIDAFLSDIGTRILKQGEDLIGNALFGKDGGLLSGLGTQISSLITPSSGAGTVSGAATSAASLAAKVGGAATNNPAIDAFTAALSTSTASVDAAFTALTATVPTLDTAFVTLDASVTTAAASLDALAATSGGDSASEGVGAAGSIFGSFLASAKGNVFDRGRLWPFALGGVINSPMIFPMRNGAGLAGEAGPEAIVPLKRGADGSLGIANHGAGSSSSSGSSAQQPMVVNQHFSVPQGTTTATQSQIARSAARGVSHATRFA